MFKKIYRAMVVAQAGSAAVKLAERMTDDELLDIGIIRGRFPLETMKKVEADFAQKDIESAKKRNAKVPSNLSVATLLNHAFLQTGRT